MRHRNVLHLAAASVLGAGVLAAAAPLATSAQVSQIGGVREARLSGNCHLVQDREAVTLAIGDARIRKGGSVRATGVRQSILVESGGSADIQGTGSTVYVMRGGRATVGGSRNQVVAETGGSVVLVGVAIMTVVDAIDPRIRQDNSDCR